MNDSGDRTNDGGDGDGVSPETLARWLDRDDPIALLDVRNREEIQQWAIDGPRVTRTEIPYVKFQAARVNDEVANLAEEIAYADVDEGETEAGNNDPVIVVCGRGEVSATVADLLVEEGIDARNLVGGMDAWARVYTETRLDVASEATVYQYRRPASGCLSYLVVDGETAAVVDPLWAFVDRYEADAATHDASLTYAIDTHVHADHVSGLRELGERGAKRVLPERAAARGVTIDVRTVADGEEVSLEDASLRAVSLPGHTTGMTGFVVGDALLAGDSLFLEGVARPDLEADTVETVDAAGTERAVSVRELAEQLHETLTARLARFDDGTLIAPGHYDEGTRPDEDGTYTARLGDIKDRLPAFDTERERFVERVLDGLGAGPANYERIVAVNRGVETIEGEEAREIELGPNNCAAGPVTADP